MSARVVSRELANRAPGEICWRTTSQAPTAKMANCREKRMNLIIAPTLALRMLAWDWRCIRLMRRASQLCRIAGNIPMAWTTSALRITASVRP